mmetsp:Transcript_4386/g.8914  ORF Transcript_4386/g.8914 Transcript_4386/m.8914 type:complete len:811 (-) Transcript_4386:11-2443(-)
MGGVRQCQSEKIVLFSVLLLLSIKSVTSTSYNITINDEWTKIVKSTKGIPTLLYFNVLDINTSSPILGLDLSLKFFEYETSSFADEYCPSSRLVPSCPLKAGEFLGVSTGSSVDYGNGTYTIEFTFFEAGNFSASFFIDSVEYTEAPFPLHFVIRNVVEVWEYIIGIFFSLLGKAAINFGMILEKYAFKRNRQLPENQHKPPGKLPLWWFGLVIFLSGNLGDVVALAFIQPSTVAALGGVSLVANALFSSCFLKEKFTIRDMFATVLIIGGSTIATAVNSAESVTITVEVFREIASKTKFLIFCIAVAAIIAILLSLSEIYGRQLNPKKLDPNPAKAAQASVSAKKILRFTYPLLSGTCGAMVMLTVKVLTEFLQVTFSCSTMTAEGSDELISVCFLHNQWDKWEPYAVFGVALGVGVGQVHYMNKALEVFDALLIIPVFYVWWTVVSIVGGGLVFDDFRAFTDIDYTLFITGCSVIFAGVVILGTRKPTTDEAIGSKVLPEDAEDRYLRRKAAERLLAMQKREALKEKKRRGEEPGQQRPAGIVSSKLREFEIKHKGKRGEDSDREVPRASYDGPSLVDFQAAQLNAIRGVPTLPSLSGQGQHGGGKKGQDMPSQDLYRPEVEPSSRPDLVQGGRKGIKVDLSSPLSDGADTKKPKFMPSHPGYRHPAMVEKKRPEPLTVTAGSSKTVLPPIRTQLTPTTPGPVGIGGPPGRLSSLGSKHEGERASEERASGQAMSLAGSSVATGLPGGLQTPVKLASIGGKSDGQMSPRRGLPPLGFPETPVVRDRAKTGEEERSPPQSAKSRSESRE